MDRYGYGPFEIDRVDEDMVAADDPVHDEAAPRERFNGFPASDDG